MSSIDIDRLYRALEYETNSKVRKLADRIHESRMLVPPACDDCIRMAFIQLGKNPEAEKLEPTISPEEARKKSKINPEWVKLEGKPHGVLLLDEHSFKSIKIGPNPKA